MFNALASAQMTQLASSQSETSAAGAARKRDGLTFAGHDHDNVGADVELLIANTSNVAALADAPQLPELVDSRAAACTARVN